MEYGPYIVSELSDCNGYVILLPWTYMYTAAELSDCIRFVNLLLYFLRT